MGSSGRVGVVWGEKVVEWGCESVVWGRVKRGKSDGGIDTGSGGCSTELHGNTSFRECSTVGNLDSIKTGI